MDDYYMDEVDWWNDPEWAWKLTEPLEKCGDDVRPQRFTDMDTSMSYIADHGYIQDRPEDANDAAGLAA